MKDADTEQRILGKSNVPKKGSNSGTLKKKKEPQQNGNDQKQRLLLINQNAKNGNLMLMQMTS